MEAKELRIGNIVNYLGKEVICNINTIYSISRITQPSVMYLPIPITEELLIKYGWIWNEETKSFEKLGFPNGHIKKTSFGWTMFNYVLKSVTTNKDFRYLHQLQNTYFALKLEELI